MEWSGVEWSGVEWSGVDPELLMKVLGNPEMAALLTSLAKTMKV